MGYTDMASLNAALKEFYDGQKVENLAYDKNPFLAMVPKNTKATGKYIPQPILYEVGQGISANFAAAQLNQSSPLLAEPLLNLRPGYDIQTISGQALEASGDDKGAFLDGQTLIIDSMLQGLANFAASSALRAGTGSIGQISSIVAGVITLTNPADIAQFGNNQTLQASTTDGGSPLAAQGYVVNRNVAAGQITVSATGQGGAPGTPAGWANTNFLLVSGTSNACISGLQAWLPATPPGIADNFYGMNRSTDSRLYGVQFPGQSMPVEEAIIDAVLLLCREKGDPRHIIGNYGSESALLKALGAKREFVDMSTQGGIEFSGVKLRGPNGTIEWFSDRNCQAATCYLLQMDTWKLHSLGTVPKISTQGDGLEMLRLGNSDGYEVRGKFYANLGCRAPGWNSQVALQV